MVCTRYLYRYALMLYLAMSGGVLTQQSIAAEPMTLEGTWKLSTPQTAFKPDGGSIPFTQKGRQRYKEDKRLQAQRKLDEYDYATARCASPGLPRLMITPERFRIWQRPSVVTIRFEWNRLIRQIDTGGLIAQNGSVRVTADPTTKRLLVEPCPSRKENGRATHCW